jgi:hypothetical protein
MKLFIVGAIIFAIGIMLLTLVRFSPPSYVKNYDKYQKIGCAVVLDILSMIGCAVMIASHYFVARIPWTIDLW